MRYKFFKILTFSLASMLPIKGAAQPNNTTKEYKGQAQVSGLVDTIRNNDKVINRSSANKFITIQYKGADYASSKIYDNVNTGVDFGTWNIDADGVYRTIPKSCITKKKVKKNGKVVYVLNSNEINKKYFDIAKKYIPNSKKLKQKFISTEVQYAGQYVQVSLYQGKKKLVTIVMSQADNKALYTTYNMESDLWLDKKETDLVYLQNYKATNNELKYGTLKNSENVELIVGTEVDVLGLYSDGSGFITEDDNPYIIKQGEIQQIAKDAIQIKR